eukprot:357709_1
MDSLQPVNTTQICDYFNGLQPNISICSKIFALRNEGIRIQQHLHQNPELSFKEVETSKFIVKYLKQIEQNTNCNLQIQSNIAKTGVVATLKGTNHGPCILFRADMDALPIQENTNYTFKSQNPNVSHACGHDYHMTILLLTAKVLCSVQHLIHGSVKFLFQPAEEIGAGAILMIKDKTANIMENVDQCYGLHVRAVVPVGTVAVNDSILMAGAHHFEINIEGVGGHAAYPHFTKDVIVAGSALIQQIQSIISRNVNPTEMGAITIGSFHAGSKGNVIGNNAKLQGTMRWFKDENEKLIKQRLNEVCKGIEITNGVKIKLQYEKYSYASVINTKIGYNIVCDAACVIVGDGLINNCAPVPGAEDFSYFIRAKPGAFFFLGGKAEDEIYHHQAKFKIDNRCIVIGCNVFTQIAMDLLMKPNTKSKL